MLKNRSYAPAAFAALAALLTAMTSSGAAEAPAGIVMAVSGATNPPLSQMTEIPADTPIRLGSAGKLTFLDYARCQLVTVAGGTLTLSRTGYKASGQVEHTTDAPCPHVYSLQEPGGAGHTAGGLIMRGGVGVPRWPVDAVFLLTGARADKVRAAAIYAEDQPDTAAVTLDLKRGRAVEPPGTLPLSPNARYRLRLSFGGGSQPEDVTFIGVVPNGTASLVVLRVD